MQIFEDLRIVGEIYDPDEEKDQVERQQNKAKIKQPLSTISSSECWLRVRCFYAELHIQHMAFGLGIRGIPGIPGIRVAVDLFQNLPDNTSALDMYIHTQTHVI